jgi:hypothetical protein
MSQFLTQLATMQLELILPTDAPAGCLHYSRAEVNQFIMHSMSYSDSDDADASLLHILRMLDYFYLSQTVSDPYSEFLAMHWAKGVTWEAYVLSIIHFAQMPRSTGTSRSWRNTVIRVLPRSTWTQTTGLHEAISTRSAQ